MFTAQACDLVLGTGGGGSGPRGIFTSLDSGETWEAAVRLGERDGDLSGVVINKIFIEEGRPNNLLAASPSSGVLGSETNGQGWGVLLPEFAGYDVFINPLNDQEIFAAGIRGSLGTILKSSNRGRAWVQIYNTPHSQAAAVVLGFEPGNTRVMYAGLTSGTIIKSTNSGETWNVVFDFTDRVGDLGIGRNTLYALTVSSGLKKSTDAGNTWRSIVLPDSPSKFNDLYMDPVDNNVLYVATSQGLFRTGNGGTSWEKLLLPAAPETNNVSAVSVNPRKGSQIFAAIRSTFYRSDDNGKNWKPIKLPSGRVISSIVVDPSEPNRVFIGLK